MRLQFYVCLFFSFMYVCEYNAWCYTIFHLPCSEPNRTHRKKSTKIYGVNVSSLHWSGWISGFQSFLMNNLSLSVWKLFYFSSVKRKVLCLKLSFNLNNRAYTTRFDQFCCFHLYLLLLIECEIHGWAAASNTSKESKYTMSFFELFKKSGLSPRNC